MPEWSGATVIETPRLNLRTYRRDDLDPFASLNADPEVMRHLGGEALTRERSDEIAEWAERCYATEGLGLLAVERRSDGGFLGFCGLHHMRWYPDDVEVGWRLAHEFWGHGYATEAATAWLGHGFGALGLTRVISITDPPNVRSIAVMRRLGMTLDHEADVTDDDGTQLHVLVHAITADQWKVRRDGIGASKD